MTTGILLRGSAKRVYLASKKSVFFIINPVAFEETDTKEIIRGATGTGSLISSEGLIVTNYHVVENANQVWVYPYAKKFNSAVAQGGRYDNMNKFSADMRPATGFSIDLRFIINNLLT